MIEAAEEGITTATTSITSVYISANADVGADTTTSSASSTGVGAITATNLDHGTIQVTTAGGTKKSKTKGGRNQQEEEGNTKNKYFSSIFIMFFI